MIPQQDPHQLDRTGARFAPDAIWPDPAHATEPSGPGSERPAGPALPGVPANRPDQNSANTGRVLSDVSSGLDPSQLVAAEQMRALGGATATARLLGLDLQPTVMGALLAPPGNSEALRYLTPALRRAALRSALLKQRSQMRRLFALLQQGADDDHGDYFEDSDGDRYDETVSLELGGETGKITRYYAGIHTAKQYLRHREHYELIVVGRMLCLLEDLSALEDYMLDRMGAFSKG
jgi:hypothetical protein